MANPDTLVAAKALVEQHSIILQQMLQQFMSAIDARFEAFEAQIHNSSRTSLPPQSRIPYFPPLGSVSKSPPPQPVTYFPPLGSASTSPPPQSVNYFPPLGSTGPLNNNRRQFMEFKSLCSQRSMKSETKPNSVMNAHDPVGSPTPEIAPSSKSDLHDLTTTVLVGGNEQASDLVGEIDEPADLVGAGNEMDLSGKLVITADLVGDEAKVAELVETKNDEEEIVEIQTEVGGAADDVTEMTFAIAGDVDGLPKPGIVAAPLVIVVERELTSGASQEFHYVAAMTKPSSKSPAFALAKKKRREATFVKDRGKPHVAVRHCRQLGCRAALRHDGYIQRQGGGCEDAWSRRVALPRKPRREGGARERHDDHGGGIGGAAASLVVTG